MVRFEQVKQFLGQPFSQAKPFKKNPSQQLVQLAGLAESTQVMHLESHFTHEDPDKKVFG